MTQSNEDHLVDFWCIETRFSDGAIFVTEQTARAVVAASHANTPLDASYTTPVFHEFPDIHGDEQMVRLDLVARISHSSPEGRASVNRQQAILHKEDEEAPE
jgi:hypothetical protein